MNISAIASSIVKISILIVSLLGLAACGASGTSSGDDTQSASSSTSSSTVTADIVEANIVTAESSTPDNMMRGQFLDSAVSGLWYETDSNSGFTDAEGFFYYLAGETVSFYLGATLLGESEAKIEVTPLDLLESGDNPDKLQNILTVLQTLDADSDPSNGIDIPLSTDDYLSQYTLPLNSFAGILAASMVVKDLVTTVTSGGSLKDALDSFEHFRETLLSDRRNTSDEVILDLVKSTWDATITSSQCGEVSSELVFNFNILGVLTMGEHDLVLDEDSEDGSCSSARLGIFFTTYETSGLFACANECTAADLNRVVIDEDVVTALSYDAEAGALTVVETTMFDGESVAKTTVLTARQ